MTLACDGGARSKAALHQLLPIGWLPELVQEMGRLHMRWVYVDYVNP